jgi:hypothetical protein
MRDILVRLTRLDDAQIQERRRDTRRRVGLAELVPADTGPAATVALVKRLADARLVVTGVNAASGQEEVDVAHESRSQPQPDPGRVGAVLARPRIQGLFRRPNVSPVDRTTVCLSVSGERLASHQFPTV